MDEAGESENCWLRRDSVVVEGGEGVDLDAVSSGEQEWG